MLCWNGSREAARAAAYSLSFLEAAEKVIVLVVDPRASAAGHGAGHGADPDAEVAAWLRHHDVKAVVQREVAPDSDVGKVILARAKDFDVDLIVMGMYGHSRLREVVLGGASRTILGSMPVPVLMAH
jgi:nucleotide-binding universal stress UspA family protein